ncbi:hypothetical protein DFH09DRAFT_1110626 [Mycena vulgaris]|nr:hypothetical protein DFH09DRAFT_1110626 [Mycena vulgaris]
MANVVITIIHYKPPPPRWTRKLGNKAIILDTIYDMRTEHNGGEGQAGEEWEREDEDGSSGLGESMLRPNLRRPLTWRVSCALKYLEEGCGECRGGSHGIAAVRRNLEEVAEGGPLVRPPRSVDGQMGRTRQVLPGNTKSAPSCRIMPADLDFEDNDEADT